MIGEAIKRYREAVRELSEVLGNEIEAVPVEKAKPESVAGVDGGLNIRKYAGFDLIAYRAVASIWGGPERFYPSRIPELKIRINTVGQSSRWASILRASEEVRTVLHASKMGLELVLLDGSILPHPSAKSERFRPDWEEMLSLYGKLPGAGVVGVVKDPKSSALTKEFAGVEFRDAPVVDSFLKPDTRTVEFKFQGIWRFYLKIGNDFPILVEYGKGNPDEIASWISGLSAGYRNLPMPILEADHAVKIKDSEMDAIESRYIYNPRLKRRRDRL